MLPLLCKQFKNPSFIKASIAFIAAVIMHFTPDNIDDLIKLLLVAYGLTDLSKIIER